MSGPGILLILDGWGEAPPAADNAIANAHTPALDSLARDHPGLLLHASGRAVGLPAGVVGNSEIGHMVMGAGRALDYDSLLVQRSVESGELRAHPLLRQVCVDLAGRAKTLHLVGLCSDGMIHSDISHFTELLHAAADSGLTDVAIHAITDGRDVADHSASGYLARLVSETSRFGVGKISTVVGRNYAMDKSGAKELTADACRLILDVQGHATAPDATTAAADPGQLGDSWLPPTVITGPGTAPRAVAEGDAILFVNFRSDRITPLVDMVADQLAAQSRRVRLLSLAQYDTRVDVPALIQRADASGGLADTLQAHGVRSVRVAEQEKFEHVTFYINGRDARTREYEEHVEVLSESKVDYVRQPEMNIEETTARVIEAGSRVDTALVIANLANIDVVGHTGDYAATVLAAQAVDRAVERICAQARTQGRWVLLVGDHGNAEQMVQTGKDGSPRPYGGHTHNQVHCVLVPSGDERLTSLPESEPALPSIAPTVLELLGIPVPPRMTAPSLLAKRTTPPLATTAAPEDSRS